MAFVNFGSLGVPANAITQSGLSGASSQLQSAFQTQFGRQLQQSELDQILSGQNLDVPDIPTTGSTGANQPSAKVAGVPTGDIVNPGESNIFTETSGGPPPIPGTVTDTAGAGSGVTVDTADFSGSVTGEIDPNFDLDEPSPTGFNTVEALGQFNITKLPSLQDPIFNTRNFFAGHKEGMKLFDPTIYGPLPARAFANLVHRGQGPPEGQRSVWFQDVFIPEVRRLQNTSTSRFRLYNPGGPPGGGGGDRAVGSDIIAQLQALFQGAGFDIGAGQFNVPTPEALFGGITGGIEDINTQLGGIAGNVPGDNIFNELRRSITGVGSDISGLGTQAGALRLPQELLDQITNTLGNLETIGDFQAPTTFAPFQQNVEGIAETFGRGGAIGGFRAPQAFNTFQSDVDTLLGRLGETGELGQGIERGITGVGDIQQAVDELLRGSFRGDEGLFSELSSADFRVGNLGRALQALEVPDLNLGGLTDQAGRLRDVIGEGAANLTGLEGALEGDVLQQLISALSSGNIGQLQEIMELFRGPEAINVQGGLTEEQLATALRPIETAAGLAARRTGVEGDLFRGIGGLRSLISGLEGRLGGGIGLEELREELAPIATGAGLAAQRVGADSDIARILGQLQTGVGGLERGLGQEGFLGGRFGDIERLLGQEGLGGRLGILENLLGPEGNIQSILGGIRDEIPGLPGGVASELERLGFKDFLRPGDLPDFNRIFGDFGTDITGLGTDFEAGLGDLERAFEGGLGDITTRLDENLPVDLSSIVTALEGLQGPGGAGTLPEGGGTGPDVADPGGFLQTLQNAITGNIGVPQPTAESLRQDPITASLLADFEKRQSDIEAQNEERLKRLGVLRGGDTAAQFLRDAEARTRGEFDIIGDAARRAQDLRTQSITQGTGLGGLLSQRELGLGELLGQVGGTQTLGGREADLNVLAGVIAALDPALDLGTRNPRQEGLAGVLAGLLPPELRDAFRRDVLEAPRRRG